MADIADTSCVCHVTHFIKDKKPMPFQFAFGNSLMNHNFFFACSMN